MYVRVRGCLESCGHTKASLAVLRLAREQALRLGLQQYSMDLLEEGPLFGIPVPAAQHELVDGVRTQGWLRQVDL